MKHHLQYFIKIAPLERHNWLWIVEDSSSRLIGFEEVENTFRVYSYQKFIGRINPVDKNYQVATADQVKNILGLVIQEINQCLPN